MDALLIAVGICLIFMLLANQEMLQLSQSE